MPDELGQKRIKTESNDDLSENSLSHKKAKTSDMFPQPDKPYFRAIIKAADAGAIIGRGGENIKRLRNDYSVTIYVPDSVSPERVLQVVGETEKICHVILEIIPTLEDYKNYTDLNFEAEIRMLVVAGYVGAIMGSGGSKIKQLREETGASIKVYEDCCPSSNERVFRINAKPHVIVEVVKRVLDTIQNTPELKQRDAKLYDPNNVDQDNGPYSPPMRAGGSGRGGRVNGPPGMYMNNAPGSGGPRMGGPGMNRPPPRMSRGGPPFYDGGNPGGYGMGDMGGGMGMPGGGPQRYQGEIPVDPNEETKTQKVSIKNEDAGAVIGKAGSTINRIRERSGCVIKIDDGQSPEAQAGQRIITITGTDQQIQFAQYLMQQSVKQDQQNRAAGGAPGMRNQGGPGGINGASGDGRRR